MVGFVALTHNICCVSTCGSILYVLCNGCNPLLTRLMLSDSFVKAKQRVTSNEGATPQAGGEGQGSDQGNAPLQGNALTANPLDESVQRQPVTTLEGPPQERDGDPSLGSEASNGGGKPAGERLPEDTALADQVLCADGIADRMDTHPQDALNTVPSAKSSVQDGQVSVQEAASGVVGTPQASCGSPVPPQTNGSPVPPQTNGSPVDGQDDKKEESPGQGEEEHSGSRPTIKGKLRPLFSNLLHGRAANEGGVVTGLKDMLKPNMTLIAGLLHKEAEVSPTPTAPVTPSVVQLDENELARIAKMSAAEEEESLHVRVGGGGSGDQKKKTRRTKRTHKVASSSHHATPTSMMPGDTPISMVSEDTSISMMSGDTPISMMSHQIPEVETESVSRMLPPGQDLLVTMLASQQTVVEGSTPVEQSVPPHLDNTSTVPQQINGQAYAKDVAPGSVLEPVLDIQKQALEPDLDIQQQALEPVLDIHRPVLEPIIDNQESVSEKNLEQNHRGIQEHTETPVYSPLQEQASVTCKLDTSPDLRDPQGSSVTCEHYTSPDQGLPVTCKHDMSPDLKAPQGFSVIMLNPSEVTMAQSPGAVDQRTLHNDASNTPYDEGMMSSCTSHKEEGTKSPTFPKDMAESFPLPNEEVRSLAMPVEAGLKGIDNDTKSDWLTKSTSSFTDPLGGAEPATRYRYTEPATRHTDPLGSAEPATRHRHTLVADNPLYMQDFETGCVSDDSVSHEYGAVRGKGAWREDSPQLTHPMQVTQNTGNKPNLAGSPQDSLQDIDRSPGNSPQDAFIDPLNAYHEGAREHCAAPKMSGEETKHTTPPPDDYCIPEYPKVNPKSIKVTHKVGSENADIWCHLSNPSKHHVLCVCMSDQLMWAIDSKGTTFHSSVANREISWQTLNKPVTYVATSSSGKVVWGIHKGVAKARTGISSTHPAGQNWKATTKSHVSIKLLAVDEDSVWALKSDGKVIQRKGVSSLVPEGSGWIDITGTEVMAFSFIACCNRVVWTLDSNGRPYVRTGISSSNISGTGWAAAKSPPLNTVSITSNGVVWVIVKEDGVIGFRTGASSERPEGKGKWWEVTISPQAPTPLVHRLRNIHSESVASLLSSEQHSIVAVNAATKAGVCVLDSTNKLHACWRSVTGYRYKKASKDGMFEVTMWTKVSAAHVAKWLVRYDKSLYCLTSSKGLFPIELVSSVQHIATSPSCIWVVASDDIWSRQGMTAESPEGISWDYIELSSMLRDRKIRHIACSDNAAWVVDSTGVPHFRFGVHPREKGTGMSPAWIPVEGNPKPFVCMAVSPDSLAVWACDEEGCSYARTHVTKDFPVGIKWEPVHPELVQRLCAANGKVFAISKKGELLSRIGITESNPIGNYWRKMPGKNYTDISATPSGEMWVIDSEGCVFVQKPMPIAVSSQLLLCESKDFEDGPETPETKDNWELL